MPLKFYPEPVVDYLYYTNYKCEGDTTLSQGIKEGVYRNTYRRDHCCIFYNIESSKIASISDFILEVAGELENSTMIYSSENKYVLLYNNKYCLITSLLEENNDYRFHVVFGNNYNNDEFGIHVYDDEDDSETIITPEF